MTCHTEAVASTNNLLAARLRKELASGSRGGTPEVHSSRSTPPKHGARSSHSPSPQSKPGGTKREVENEDACLNAHNFNSIEIAAFIVSCAGRFELQCLSCALALSLYLFPLV